MRSRVADYDVIAPASLEEALRLMGEEPGSLVPISGGTELMVALAAGRLTARKFVSLAGLAELRFIRADSETVSIGAGTTFSDLRKHPLIVEDFPLLAKAASWTGSIANQNRGTIGGNLANASPAADSSPALLVYDAELTLSCSRGTRTLPYCDFHVAYKKSALQRDELIEAITLRRAARKGEISYIRKVGTRNAQAISKVVVAGLAHMSGGTVSSVRLAAASLHEIPLRLFATEREVIGKRVTGQTITMAHGALMSEIRPIDDIRSTARYRAAVGANLLEEFLRML